MSSGEFTQVFIFENEYEDEFVVECVVEWEVTYYSPAEAPSWDDYGGCEGNGEEMEFEYNVYPLNSEREAELPEWMLDQIEEVLYDYTLEALKRQERY